MPKKTPLPRSKISIIVTTVIQDRVSQEDNYEIYKLVGKETETPFVTKESGMKSGVYEIRNKITGERYIGQSRDIEKRINRHKNELIHNEHHCVLLQNAYYSSPFTRPLDVGLLSEVDDIFEFNVIIYCRPSELTYYEHMLIKAIKPEYNTHMENGHSRARIAKESEEM